MDLDPGVAKLKKGGGHGGHNGLKDIIAKMANQKDFMRLRIGIGHPGHREMVTGWVLGKAAKEDQEKMDAAVDEAVRCMEILAKDGVLKAQNRLHSFKP
jgi:PTH1 family peptidyl-tRNA hydrolase